MMKKKIIVSVITLVLFSILCVIPAFAASATANVNSVSANRGATVTMTVTLPQGVTVGSGGIQLTYDKAVLELVKGEWNVSGTMLATFDASTNKGAFAYASATAISGKVFTATFQIKSNAAFGDSAVKMTLQLKDGSNADISVTNNAGKVTVTCKHSYSKWSSVNGTSHTRTCSICQNKETKNHAFTNACDTSCNDCGYTRTTTHNYKTTWSNNASQHWHECSVCKTKKDVANHTPGAAATETTPQTCTTCGYVIQKALGHTHTYDQTWNSDESGHWQVCTSCQESSTAVAHKYDNDCDTNCNTCGYVRTVTHSYGNEFRSDENEHWHVCGICQESSEKVAHAYDNDCDTSCNDCDHTRKTTHVFDAGVVTKAPTADTAGEKTYTCSVCGTTKTVELEYFVPTDAPDTEGDETTDPIISDSADASTPTSSQGSPILFSIIGAVVGALVGTVVTLVICKKRKV